VDESVTYVTFSPIQQTLETGWRSCDNLAISHLQHEEEAA
jgi:hypothetical protein